MARVRNVLWWIAFVCAGIVLQVYLPRLDALIVGVIIVMQEKDWKTMVWLVPLILMLQEGMGTQFFGATLLWIVSCLLLYRLWLPVATASVPLFVLLISAGMGAIRWALYWLFATLQNYPFSTTTALNISITHAIYVPIAWMLLSFLRRPFRHDDHKEDA